MNEMVVALIRAAKQARTATFPARIGVIPTQEVLIYVTEIGFVITGAVEVGGAKRHTAREIDFIEFEDNPDLLANSVDLVRAELNAAEALP